MYLFFDITFFIIIRLGASQSTEKKQQRSNLSSDGLSCWQSLSTGHSYPQFLSLILLQFDMGQISTSL